MADLPQHVGGVGQEPLQAIDIFVDDRRELATAVFKASLASSPADAAFIEVSGVLKSCARASSTVARNSLLSRAASTFAVAWSARGRWPASGAESIFAADGAGGERRGEARGGAAQYAGLSLYGGIGVEAEQREKLNGSGAT